MEPVVDAKSVLGKYPAVTRHVQLLVVGAGPAGVAAAIAGAEAGLDVMLVDENPVAGGLMGLDVPLFYGQRMTGAVQQKRRLEEQLLATNPELEIAFERGVEVLMGTYAWCAFVNGPGLQSLPGRVAGLADEDRAWLVGFDELVLATGARDLVLTFAGAEMPGIMGANALHALLARYDAFAGKRLVVLGSDRLARDTAVMALDRGIDVAAIVEVLPIPASDLSALAARGVEILAGHAVLRAEGGLDGVEALVLRGPDGERRIPCDTICLAIGLVPNIELADVLGCRIHADGSRGGHVPVLDDDGMASIDGIFPVGDAAGLGLDPLASGRRAAAMAARRHGTDASAPMVPAEPGADAFAYRMGWMRALLASGDESVQVCLCEEVTRGEILGVKPPRYLGCRPDATARHDSAALLADGPLSHDQFKRLTRVSMGPCQARRCREQVALMLAVASGKSPADLPLAGYRAPVRPLPLSVLASLEETQAMRDHWEVWFGIPSQWIPYADIGTDREVLEDESGLGGNIHL